MAAAALPVQRARDAFRREKGATWVSDMRYKARIFRSDTPSMAPTEEKKHLFRGPEDGARVRWER